MSDSLKKRAANGNIYLTHKYVFNITYYEYINVKPLHYTNHFKKMQNVKLLLLQHNPQTKYMYEMYQINNLALLIKIKVK